MLEKLQQLIEDLLSEGEALKTTKYQRNGRMYVDLEKYTQWLTKCEYLANMVGEFGTNWNARLSVGNEVNKLENVVAILGTLAAIKDLGARELLFEVTELVHSEISESLIEQAEYLYERKYYLASAVTYRAILEEHLRNRCQHQNATPDKDRPMLSDYVMALYKGKKISKTQMKWLESVVSVGNDAAHNAPDFNPKEVERMYNDVPKVLRDI